MTLPAEGTLLVLEGIGIPLYAARGLTETFGKVAAQLERSCNGGFIDFTPDWAKDLYTLEISCEDVRLIAPDHLRAGDAVTVSAVTEFYYDSSTGGAARTPVSGSERVEGSRTFYRPTLDMIVMEPVNVVTDEYGAKVSWTLKLEEAAPDESTS